ncbi:hypothetical protein niasHT_004881 [Heterodera trifolii]|uniref:Major sperm protein n=1 Tax=Heterodera trifolii TaxID=157864 RepID=A0ABD2LR92_9BILA
MSVAPRAHFVALLPLADRQAINGEITNPGRRAIRFDEELSVLNPHFGLRQDVVDSCRQQTLQLGPKHNPRLEEARGGTEKNASIGKAQASYWRRKKADKRTIRPRIDHTRKLSSISSSMYSNSFTTTITLLFMPAMKAVWLDPSDGTCITDKGAKTVTVLNTGHKKARVTVILTARSDGKKLQPFVLLPKKRPIPNIINRFKSRLHLCSCGRVWMDNELTTEYLEKKEGAIPNGLALLKQRRKEDAVIKGVEEIDLGEDESDASTHNSNDDTVRDEANSHPLHAFFVSQILPLIKPTKCGSDCEINKIRFSLYESWQEMFLSTSPTCQWSTTIRLITYVSNCFASVVSDRIWSSPLHPLSKWLHTARSDGQPKVIKVRQLLPAVVDELKTLFFNATASVNFLVVFEQITFFKQGCFSFLDANQKHTIGNCFSVCLKLSLSAGNPGLKPNFDAFDGLALDNFVLDNGQTNERLSFRRVPGGTYGQMFLMERGPKKRGRNEQQWTRSVGRVPTERCAFIQIRPFVGISSERTKGRQTMQCPDEIFRHGNAKIGTEIRKSPPAPLKSQSMVRLSVVVPRFTPSGGVGLSIPSRFCTAFAHRVEEIASSPPPPLFLVLFVVPPAAAAAAACPLRPKLAHGMRFLFALLGGGVGVKFTAGSSELIRQVAHLQIFSNRLYQDVQGNRWLPAPYGPLDTRLQNGKATICILPLSSGENEQRLKICITHNKKGGIWRQIKRQMATDCF